MLDEEPLRLGRVIAGFHSNECPRAAHSVAEEGDLEITLRIGSAKVCLCLIGLGAVSRVGAVVPQHDSSAAVLTLRNRSFEGVVRDGMILDLHGEPLHRRIGAGAFWNSPALHYTVELQAKVVMKMRRGVLLDYKPKLRRLCNRRISRRLGCAREIALSLVFGKARDRALRRCLCCHGSLLQADLRLVVREDLAAAFFACGVFFFAVP
jgi:hypothetical protein